MFTRRSNAITLEIKPFFPGLAKSLYSTWVRSSDLLVIFIAIAISFIGWKYYFDQSLILAYNDSMSHLDIARRVVEGLKPGFAQIGSVWLPLPHILMLPFIGSSFLWHTGLAGSYVSILAFIASGFFIYKIAFNLTRSYLAAIIGFLVFSLNPNMVYMQSIPMTESLLVLLFVASFHFMLIWERTSNFRYLIIAGLFVFFATLTRYDGWILLLQILPIILVISVRKKGWRGAESNLILFMMLAFYGIILWFLWNLLIFGDPLYFATGPFSAKAQQMVFEAEGRLFSKGNLLYSVYIYTIAVVRNNGAVFTFFAGVGAVLYLIKNRLRSETLIVSLLLSPFIFNVAALYLGHSIINLPDIPPYTLFNVRYGLMMLPSIAILVAYLCQKRYWFITIVLIILFFQTSFMYQDQAVITVNDGVRGASAQNMTTTGHWLNANVGDQGLILIAASSQDSLIFQSQLPMKRFITEGAGDYWSASLENPTKHAKYVAMHHGDMVYNRLFENENFLNNYEKVYDGEFTDIYELSISRKKPLTVADLP